ncbi:hypothetical protein [Burkholderia diffusa]|uniref:hypothetical protein n=1 Tax=Burkholderia diffusa TaxID=488732 RepID=UPI000A74C84D|nr:hypothetical protein [Burkholderia diffusa]
MAINNFKPFAAAAGANVMSQADYEALAALLTGFQSGTAQSAQLNKVWRQGSIMAAVLAQFIVDRSGQDAIDDGTISTLLANLKASVAALNGDPGQSFSVAAATSPQHAVQYSQVRKLLTGNLSLYVATTGSDTANTGLSASSPFATLQKAYNYLQSTYDLNGFTATINVAAGTYTAGLNASGPIAGNKTGTDGVIISGAGATINVGSSQYCFNANQGARFKIQGFTMQSSGSASNAVQLTDPSSSIVVGTGNTFGAFTSGTHLNCSGGQISVQANYTISGGAAYHLLASNSGANLGYQSGLTVTVSGTPAFSQQFAASQFLGLINAAGTTFSGSATGTRYLATINGVINTNGGGASFFPGSVAGSTSSGGIYG